MEERRRDMPAMEWKEEMILEKMRLAERRLSERMDRLSLEQKELEQQLLRFPAGEQLDAPGEERKSERNGFRRFETIRILVIHDGTSEASLALYIGRLADFCPDWQFELRLLCEVTSIDVIHAALIVCVRWLGEVPFSHLIRMFQIPMYYYTDDCFTALENPESCPDSIRETIGNTNREFLSRFSGVILSTPALRDAFHEKGLHERLYVHPLIFKTEAVFPHSHSTECIRAAFYGGAHRVPVLLNYVLPALMKLSSQVPVELYLPPVDGIPADLGEGMKIVTLPYMAFEEGLRVYAERQIDLLLYPSLPQNNNSYKTYNALFSAVSLDAVLIGSRDEPLASLPGNEAYCILAENSQTDWENAFQRFWNEPEEMQRIRWNARSYCEEHSGEKTIIADYRVWLERAKETAVAPPMREFCLSLRHRQIALMQELERQRRDFAAELEQQRQNVETELKQQRQNFSAALEQCRCQLAEDVQRTEQKQRYQQAALLELMQAEHSGRLSRLWNRLSGRCRKADLTDSLQLTQPNFLKQLQQKNRKFTPSRCLVLSSPAPFHTYMEYSVESPKLTAGQGNALHFFVFASPQSSVFLEAVKDSQIVKQEALTLSGDGEIRWPLEVSGGTLLLRIKTLDNFSIVRVLEMARPCRGPETAAYYFEESGESK